MHSAGFEPTISAGERPKTYALDRAATGTGKITVVALHKSFLVNDQRDTQYFSMYLFIFLTLYMFRAHRAHHQERQIVSVQPVVAVGGRVVCRSEVNRVTATRGCIDTIYLS